MSWGFEVGRVFNRRSDIHARFAGQQQGGIITPADHPVVIIITGEEGLQHGYADHYRFGRDLPDGLVPRRSQQSIWTDPPTDVGTLNQDHVEGILRDFSRLDDPGADSAIGHRSWSNLGQHATAARSSPRAENQAAIGRSCNFC